MKAAGGPRVPLELESIPGAAVPNDNLCQVGSISTSRWKAALELLIIIPMNSSLHWNKGRKAQDQYSETR
jgi:hypothetical protein